MMTHRLARTSLLIGCCVPFGLTPLLAQRTPPAPPEARRPAPAPRPQVFINGGMRAGGMLGVNLAVSSGADDTLGILIQSVQSGMAAEKAGIREGARIVSVDGVDLRLEPRDVGDFAAERVPESRLRRAISDKSPGETITLEVRQDGRTETKRVTLDESPMPRIFGTTSGGRRVLGLGFAMRGSMRDTAGLLITSISEGSAADKAGLAEGDRVVSVDGIDLRVPAAEAGSPDGVEARISRLRRALDAARDSQPVRLELLSEGRRRTVSVTPQVENAWGMMISPSAMQGMAADIRASVNRNMMLSESDRREIERARSEAVRDGARARAEGMRAREEIMRDRDEARRERDRERRDEMRDAEREMRDGQRELGRARVEIERAARDGFQVRVDDDDDAIAPAPRRRFDDDRAERRNDDRRAGGIMRGRTDGATLSLDGLALASVDRDFGQQFGKGAERGALVVRARDEWQPLRAGDVILAIEGRSVRDGNALDVSIDRSRDQRIEILRNGRSQTITLRASR